MTGCSIRGVHHHRTGTGWTLRVSRQLGAETTPDRTLGGYRPVTVQNAVKAAIDQAFLDYGSVNATGTTVPLSYVQSAIAAVAGTAGFLVTSPTTNIASAGGQLPVRGVVTFV